MANLLKGRCLVCLVMDTARIREAVGEERGVEVCHDHRLDLREGKMVESLFQKALHLLVHGEPKKAEDGARRGPVKANAAKA